MLLISEKVGGEFCRLPALIEIPRCYEYLFACVKRNKMGSGLLLIKNLLSISQTSFQHCHVCFQVSLGQPLLKQQYKACLTEGKIDKRV